MRLILAASLAGRLAACGAGGITAPAAPQETLRAFVLAHTEKTRTNRDDLPT